MDASVLWKLSYGMYAIGTLDGTRPTGCIVNTVVQITSTDPVLAVSMNKNNFTCDAIKKAGRFAVSILSEQTSQNVIARLGFTSGRDTDKFAGNDFAWEKMGGMPIVKENACGWILLDVIAMYEVDTHYIIVAKVTDAKSGSNYAPMTYKYYHEVIKGKAPKNAPTYQEEQPEGKPEGDVWVCSICGYVYEGDLTKEPDDYKCPICKQPKSVFVKK